MALIKQLSLYFFSSIIVKAAAFFIIPVMMQQLSPAAIGLFSLTNTFIALVSTIMSFGLRQVLSLEYFHCSSHESKGELINDILVLYGICALPFLVGGISSFKFLNATLFAHQASPALIIMSLLYCFVLFFTELFYQILMYEGHAYYLMLIQLSAVIISAGGGIVALSWMHTGLVGVFGAQLLGACFVCGVGIIEYKKRVSVQLIDVQRLTQKGVQYLKWGLPFVPSVLAAWVISATNRWLLLAERGLSEVGIYAVAEMAITVFNVVILYPIGAAYVPYMLKKYAQEKERLFECDAWNKKIMWGTMSVIGFVIIVGYLCLQRFLYAFMPVVYHEAVGYMLCMSLGQLFLMGTYFSACFIQFMKKTLFINVAFVGTALFNGISAYFLLRWWGIGGAVFSLMSAYVLYFILLLWYNKRLHTRYALREN